jgi:hypothetical protein
MRLFFYVSVVAVTLLSAFTPSQAAPHKHCWWHHHHLHCHA